MSSLRVLGVDPGFANIGVCLMLFTPAHEPELLELSLIETKKDSRKKNIREKSDDMRRLGEIRDEFHSISKHWDYDVVAFEEMPGAVLSKGVIRKIASAWGACWALLTRKRGVLSFEYSFADIKRVVTGRKQATKAEIIGALGQRFPELLELEIPDKKREHPADAIAVALLAMQDPAVINLSASLARFAG